MRNTIATLMVAGVAALVSLPAVAAPPPPPQPHVQFGFNFGTSPPPPPHYGHGPVNDDDCLSTGEILGGLRDNGYRSLRYLGDDGDVRTVRARLGYKRYILQVDDCSGDVVARKRIYQ